MIHLLLPVVNSNVYITQASILFHSLIIYLAKHCVVFQWSACNTELNFIHLCGSLVALFGN